MKLKTERQDPRVDAYIAKSAEFAQPILNYLRTTVHAACPQAEETLKWGFPHFTYKGLLCNMAAFKAHCSFGFWKGRFIVAQGDKKNEQAMGQFGRITSLKDLPSKKQIVAYIGAAMRINDAGVPSSTKTKRAPRKPLLVPKELASALKKNKAARATFESFSATNRREYVEWISEAKTDETRVRRLTTTMKWLAESKARNWKYQSKNK